MTLVKYQPRRWGTTPAFSRLFDDFFGKEFPGVIGNDTVSSLPSVNVIESEKAFRLELAAPGLSKKDFNITVENDLLTISSKIESNTEETTENFTRREFNYSSFSRSFTLPETINAEKIEAKYNDGVLNVTIPKKEEAYKESNRTIKVS